MSIKIPFVDKIETSLKAIFLALFDVMSQSETTLEQDIVWQESSDIHPILKKILAIYRCYSDVDIQTEEDLNAALISFKLSDEEAASAMHQIEQYIKENCPQKHLGQAVSYLLGELVCNIQQHAKVETGILFAEVIGKYLYIGISDGGVTIYGSYLNAQKYLEKIGFSDAEALSIAKEGYSTKNLPNAENRGYGISSNLKMITRGLHGVFSIISGSALLYADASNKQVVALPQNVNWNGTLVMVQIPLEDNNDFKFYDYIY